MTFPWIRERVIANNLKLRGAYFNVADASLLALNPDSGVFEPLD
jgi:hypothetical protein